MSFLETLAEHVRTEHPDWHVELSEDGQGLLIGEANDGEALGPLRFFLRQSDGAVLLEDLWRLPLSEGQEEVVRDLVLDTLKDGFENRGWEVPIVLVGGPLQGKRLTKTWEDLVGRLVFAKAGRGGKASQAFLYKWHLKRDGSGNYLCQYERTLKDAEMDDFLRRGVASTGPFVLIRLE